MTLKRRGFLDAFSLDIAPSEPGSRLPSCDASCLLILKVKLRKSLEMPLRTDLAKESADLDGTRGG